MTNNDLKAAVKNTALMKGADLVGIVRVDDLPEYKENIMHILSAAEYAVVVVARHGLAAIRSENNQVAQFDTINTYNQCSSAAHAVVGFLQSKGFPSVAVPPFIPIDMQSPKNGMRGEICWRRAGVRAGLGSYGENGLLVTREFGAAIRISGLVTSAHLTADSPLTEEVCIHCGRCVESCPVKALSGGGKINKKLCGDRILKFGFRYFKCFLHDLVTKESHEIDTILNDDGLKEIWQTFMTGNYYYCFKCQSQCPVSDH